MKKSTHPIVHQLHWLELSKSRIAQNASLLFDNTAGIAISPVLKSNAFGHGIGLVGALIEQSHTVPFYSVSSLYEAVQLRSVGITSDIFIMGYVDPSDLAKKQWDFCFALFDIEQAKMISRLQKKPRVHINAETGLHREGLDVLQFAHLLEEVKKLKNLTVEGLMSHYACSNDPTCPITDEQIAKFQKAKELVLSYGFTPKWFHMGGSLALLNNLATGCNVVRAGKAFFAVSLTASYQATSPAKKTKNRFGAYQPVLTLKTKIAQVKHIKKGDHVSYADAFVAPKDMTIAILPIGYNDGLDRRLSNRGVVKIGNVFCPIIGLIAMNVTCIDVSKVKNASMDDEVIVYSQEATDPNSFENAAKTCGTIAQELLVKLPVDMPRVLVE